METDPLRTDTATLRNKRFANASARPFVGTAWTCKAALFQQLLSNHRTSLKTALIRRFGAPPPEPDDAIQTAILKFLELERKETVTNVPAFLYALSRNLMIDEIRRIRVRARHKGREQQEAANLGLEADHSTPETFLLQKERSQLLDQAVQSLPAGAREILVLSRIEALPYTEISRRTGHSTAYISRSVQRSMQHLSAYLHRREREENCR